MRRSTLLVRVAAAVEGGWNGLAFICVAFSELAEL